MGFFSGDAVAEVTVAVQVKTPDGRIWFAHSVTGEAKEGGVMLALGHNAKASLDKALTACVSRLVSDRISPGPC